MVKNGMEGRVRMPLQLRDMQDVGAPWEHGRLAAARDIRHLLANPRTALRPAVAWRTHHEWIGGGQLESLVAFCAWMNHHSDQGKVERCARNGTTKQQIRRVQTANGAQKKHAQVQLGREFNVGGCGLYLQAPVV